MAETVAATLGIPLDALAEVPEMEELEAGLQDVHSLSLSLSLSLWHTEGKKA
jgi:hypothetical protein